MTLPLKIDITHLPHKRPRTDKIRYIILHCSAYTPEKQMEILDDLELSTHYIIGQDGKIYEVVPPEETAFHAGVSSWKKSTAKSLNDCSIGIEMESPTLGQSPKDYPRKQRLALYQLLKELMKKYHIGKANILGHSDIAPTRKPDPGAAFPWEALGKRGLAVKCGRALCSKDRTETAMLSEIGYDVSNLSATRYAFCRRFLAEEVEVIKDIRTLVNTPYPEAFCPKNFKKYIRRLRAATEAFKTAR